MSLLELEGKELPYLPACDQLDAALLSQLLRRALLLERPLKT
jgi:hypothetical protein